MQTHILMKLAAAAIMCATSVGVYAQKKTWYLYWSSPDQNEVAYITDDQYSSDGVVVVAWSRIYNQSTRRLTFSADLYDCSEERTANNYFEEYDTAVKSQQPIRHQETKDPVAKLQKVKWGSRQHIVVMNVCSSIGPRARPWQEAGDNFRFQHDEILKAKPHLRNLRP